MEYDRGDEVPIPTEADLSPAGDRRPQRLGRRERPCPETRYLLYPVPGTASITAPVWDERYPRTPVELFDFLADPVAVSQPGQRQVA